MFDDEDAKAKSSIEEYGGHDEVRESLEGPGITENDLESPNSVVNDDEEDEGGLFGSGSEDGESPAIDKGKRRFDDEELDSGDDEGRDDRAEDETKGASNGKHASPETKLVMEVPVGKSPIPTGNDGEMYLLKLPKSIGIEPKCFDVKTFQPPTTDHHSSGPPSSTFSAHQVAMNTICWRHSPRDPNILQSNARILRWSDGSFTLQLASNPLVQYELPATALAPPQVNPPKPTPTSVKRPQNAAPDKYDPDLDTHTYLAFPHESASTIRVTNKVTASLQVQSTNDKATADDAVIRLKESLAAAAKANKGAEAMLQITEDPELAKKKAELAEKEKMRAQKRRQNQEERERDRANRHLGRVGLRTTGAGLTVGGLEDDDGPARPRAKPVRKPRRRNSEYSEDEEDYRNRGKTKEDEYDEDDGFLVKSDEEEELMDDDEDEEDEDVDMDEDEDARRKKSKGKSMAKEDAKPVAEEVASGSRGKRRTVIDDEDEDD